MKVNEIITESKMSTLAAVISDAEAKAFDDADQDKSAVSGDAVMKYAKQGVKQLHQGDVPAYNAAMRAVEQHIKQEYGK